MGLSVSAVQNGVSMGAQKNAMHWRIILMIAVMARICFALVYFNFSSVPPIEGRGYENVAIALSLRAGHGFSSPFFTDSGPTAFMTPLYPSFLAAIMSVSGTGSIAATIMVVVQELFSLATVVLVMYVARANFNERAGNMAGLFCALWPPMLNAPVLSWDACLSAFLLMVVFAAASSKLLARGRFIPAGLVCALAGLLNPALLPSLWAVCGWSAWKAKIVPWAGMLMFFVAFSPWLVRNALVMHAFVPLRTNFGYELWQGNHPGATGEFNESMNPMMNAYERQEFIRSGELRYFSEKGELARGYISSHLLEFVRLDLKRIWEFWTLWQDGSAPSTIPILLLAIAGLAMVATRRDLVALYALPLILYPLPYYITHVYDRFEWVIEPLLLVLSGYAMSRFFEGHRPSADQPGTGSVADRVEI
jgi:hypothetical protein